jgi:hypothetical protein
VVQLTVKPKDEPLLGGAKLRGVLDQSFENGLEFERRAADDLEHVGGRGLLLQRLAQLVEQARISETSRRTACARWRKMFSTMMTVASTMMPRSIAPIDSRLADSPRKTVMMRNNAAGIAST